MSATAATSAAGGDVAIAFSDVTVRYGKRTVLERVSFEVPRGSVFALLGRNGTGKTTAVRCLLGQQRPTSGRVLLLGQDVWKRRAELMERVGVVPEEPDAPPGLTAREIARFCARLYPRWDQASVDARLERFRVPQNVRFQGLSRGQKAQVQLALALAFGPEMLVLDDPTLGLDAVARKEFFGEVIVEIADRGLTVLLTTHDLPGVERIGDRVAILKDAALAVNEPVEDLKGRFRRVRDARGTEVIVERWTDDSLDRIRAERDGSVAEALPLTLEEIFAQIVGEDPFAQTAGGDAPSPRTSEVQR